MSAIQHGILLGLGLSYLVGPVFIALINTSLKHGFGLALRLAVGIALSDALIILVANLLTTKFSDLGYLNSILHLAGGVILILFGAIMFFSKKKPDEHPEEHIKEISLLKRFGFYAKGFVLNLAHPGVLFFWIGMVTVLNTEFNYSTDAKITMYSATVLTVFCFDCLKAGLARFFKRFIKSGFLHLLNRIMGVGLFGFGVYFLLKYFGVI